jgi:hypothetical protein
MCPPRGHADLVFGSGGVFHVPQQYTLQCVPCGMEERPVRAVASKLYQESMRLLPLQTHLLTYRSCGPRVWHWRCVLCTSAIYLVVCTLGNGGEAGKGGWPASCIWNPCASCPCNPMCSPRGHADLVFGIGGVFHVPQQYTL